MKLQIDRAVLLKALAHVQGVVERKNVLPILTNTLLRASGESLSLTATDMEIEIVETVPAVVARAGETTVPAHIFYEIVRKLPDNAKIELDVAGEQMTVRAARSVFRLGTLPVADFPAIGQLQLPTSFTLGAAELRTLIDRTRFAMSTEETRYYLNGLHIHDTVSNDVPVLRAVATDGHRLARAEMPLPDGARGMPKVIVPRKAIGEIRKLLDEVSGPVEVTLSENKLRVGLRDLQLTTKLIDGTFPDYEKVIPTGNDKTLEVDPKSFLAAVDRIATVATERSRAVKLSLNQDQLTVSAQATDGGAATEDLEVAYGSSPIEIGFNARYLMDIAQQIEGDGVQLQIADGASPTLIRDSADQSFLYVLMPMRV